MLESRLLGMYQIKITKIGILLFKSHVYMAHRTGFNMQLLDERLNRVGFRRFLSKKRPEFLDLWFIGFNGDVSESEAREMFSRYTDIPMA